MYKTILVTMLAIAASGTSVAAGELAFEGDFETGEIQSASAAHDGFYIRTLPEPQSGSAIATGSNGFGPSAKVDTRVVRSEIVGSESVKPRKGLYFIRSAIYYKKNYTELNGGSEDKPRSDIGLSDPAQRFDYDVESYLAFSIYVPENYEHETATKGVPGGMQLMVVKETETASRSFIRLDHRVPSGASAARWSFSYVVSPKSTLADDGQYIERDLGAVDADRGKWTDFIIRFRENPFSSDTNPGAAGISDAMNQLYRGNKGILQVWKAEGAVDGSGNRKMVLKIDKVNEPVGLVPHKSMQRMISFRIYKYGWKKNPTSVDGPIWLGFDEVRFGFAGDGVAFNDVAPSGVSCASGCSVAELQPAPPADLVVQ